MRDPGFFVCKVTGVPGLQRTTRVLRCALDTSYDDLSQGSLRFGQAGSFDT
jgi:hypothetical protein